MSKIINKYASQDHEIQSKIITRNAKSKNDNHMYNQVDASNVCTKLTPWKVSVRRPCLNELFD